MKVFIVMGLAVIASHVCVIVELEQVKKDVCVQHRRNMKKMKKRSSQRKTKKRDGSK